MEESQPKYHEEINSSAGKRHAQSVTDDQKCTIEKEAPASGEPGKQCLTSQRQRPGDADSIQIEQNILGLRASDIDRKQVQVELDDGQGAYQSHY